MYIRIENFTLNTDTAVCCGLFQIAYSVLESERIAAEEATRLHRVLKWFEVHLPSPKLEALDPQAVFWLKDSATPFIEKLWELASVLRMCEIECDLIKTLKPGYVIYEDCVQIAAIPFKDT